MQAGIQSQTVLVEKNLTLSREITFKIYFTKRNEIRRWKTQYISWELLSSTISSLFKLSAHEYQVKYADEDGDLITISSTNELNEMLKSINNILIKLYVIIPGGAPTNNNNNNYNNNYNNNMNRKELYLREKARKKQEKEIWKSQKRMHKLDQRRNKQAKEWARSEELHSRFVMHITIDDDAVLSPDSPFIKTWRIRNEGTIAWSAKTKLIFLSRENGEQFNTPNEIEIGKDVNPGDCIDLSVQMKAPKECGSYIGFWRLATKDGIKFGQRFWCRIIVLKQEEEKKNNNVVLVEEEEEENEKGDDEEMKQLLEKLKRNGI